jgi:amino acid adenylation domain-containing protein/non-ribosomal peptide synthase protein (TIGR01720 family)
MTSPNARIANLSQEKQALLAKLLQQKTTVLHTRIAKREQQLPCPLSYAQERLWFLAQMDADSPFYNIAGVVQLHGKLNSLVLEQALNEVIRRHEALRTAFLMTDQPQQQIVDFSPLALATVNLSDLELASQKAALAIISHQEAHRVFDLTQTPLLRATLLKLNAQQHVLLMTLHHIVSDEWSLGLFIKELGCFYDCFSQGKPSSEPELSLQYPDFACWQRQQLQSELHKKQLAYWTARLANAPKLLEFPTDKPRPLEQTYRGASHHFSVSAYTLAALQQLNRQTDTTLFMLLMAAFSVLLQRHSGQIDLCIGYPVANRNRKDIEKLIGFFVNTQVLRADLSGNPHFDELLGQIKEHILNAQNNQDVPFEQLVDELKPERNLSYTPLFQVMLVFQNAPAPPLNLPDLRFDIANAAVDTAKFDLTLTITQGEQGLHGDFNYRTDLFEHSSIARLAEQWQILIAGISEQSHARLSELPLLTPAEQQQMLDGHDKFAQVMNANEFAPTQLIHSLVEQQAEKNPDAVAVVFAEQSLSYAQLNSKANQLAHYLKAQGVKADTLVGVCLERSLDMIISLLAILKAGGAYLPIDPDYPPERVAYMLNDAQVSLVLTQNELINRVASTKVTPFCVDSDWATITHHSPENLAVSVNPFNLAYVIYTSGSTGNPKGVMVTHAQVTRLFTTTETEFQFNAHDVWTMFHSYAFDFSVWEIWGALVYGGRLVLVPYWISRSPKEFSQLLQAEQVTVLNQTPSAFMQLVNLEAQNQATDYKLRLVIFGGEALDLSNLKPWFDKYGDQQPQLVNMYGITETTVHVTYRALTMQDVTGSPIGRPISDLQIYLLDAQQSLCPLNSRGELFVGGAGLARGYLNRPDLTAERFVPNPFGAAGSRLYKSGDLGRHGANGDIDYLGRIDHQVKIRGFRIELGEIEAALLTHADIKEAIVLARDEGGRKQLVAYLITTSAQIFSTETLHAHLKHRLPDYMLPSAFVYLDTFPLTANGKLDRKALPAPTWSPNLGLCYVAPQMPIEKTLVNVWQDLLNLEQIGINDNFFALGGDSILSIQVVSRARQLGILITPKQLFQHQTIAALAQVANQETIIAAEQGLVSGNLPLTPIQQWFFEQNFVNPQHWNQALLFEMKAGYSAEMLEHALKQLIRHHDALRLQFYQQDGVWQQRNAKEVPDNLLVYCDLSSIAAEQQAAALDSEASKQQARLNLSTGQLVRGVWFDMGTEQNSRVLIIIHHLVVDGVSWRILLEDLTTLLSGQTLLPAKTTAFKQWAETINDCQSFKDWQSSAIYWLDARRNNVLALPVDNTAGLNTVATEHSLSFSLSSSDTQALLKDANAAYQTKIDDLLLTALVQTLSAWSQQTNLLIDLEGHGREDLVGNLDVSRTVGWFTCLFPVLLTDSSLPAIKEQLRAVPQKGMSYGCLRYSEYEPKLALQPKAQVMFNYLGQFDSALSENSPFIPLADHPAGINRDTHGSRTHEFEIVSHIANGQLQLTWRYSSERYVQSTIAALMQRYEQNLIALIAHCLQDEVGAYTASDFSLAALTTQEFDELKLPARQVEDLYPLAPLQHGLLFHSLYAPDSGVYCVQLGCQLQGALNVDAFKQAWQQIVNNHAVFRTHFQVANWEKPLQQVSKHALLPFSIYDWRELDEQTQTTRWQQLLLDDAKIPFDFTRPPLMRLGLVQCNEQRHYFFWSHHHVLLDGWSNSLIMQEVFTQYGALTQGNTAPIATPRPYRDYIAWLQGQDLAAAKAYWQKTLSGFTAPTSLGISLESKPRFELQAAYARHALIFSTEQTQVLQDFVKQQQLTLNTLVQGVWVLLLSRYSGEQDIVFGTTVSGRPAELSGVEFMVGLFINSLPVRVQVAPETHAVTWLKELFEQNQELRHYEYTPLVDIQGWSDVPRGTALFDSLLVFENYPIDAALTGTNGGVQHAGLVIENIATMDYTSYPLTVSAFPSDQFKLEITYDCQRFDDTAITRMLGHLQQLITAIVTQPNSRLYELSLLTASEYQQLVVANNATAMDYVGQVEGGMHHLFEQQVTKNPDAIALVFGTQSLSYEALNQRANQVAHYLLTLGIRPDNSVAVCMERSVEMIVAVLGILKAGGAYLPLDPNYPADRLAYMLNDAAPVVLLTNRRTNLGLYSDLTTIPQLMLDADSAILDQQSISNPAVSILPKHLAYIIYTSGSTGQPKGVMIEHCNALNFIEWAKQAFSFFVLEHTLFATSLNFDLAVYELFVPLSVGATVHLVQDLLAVNASLDTLTLINTVPSAMNALINSQPLPDSVHNVNLAGEPLKPALAERIFANSQVQTIANLYGPTETTTYSTWTTITKGQSFPAHIGRPIANTQIYILDAYLQLVPQGIAGEIYIGGAGVARGYLNRPDLTAERFLQDPFTENGRMYKTGDLGRWLADGNIEYRGRNDFQVKIRGFRIELGEIEARLNACQGVREAVVMAREDNPDDKRLVAYLLAHDDSELSTTVLRTQLATVLADYMIPSAFIILPEFPLTPNGKLNRNALPAPDFCEAQQQYVAPRTTTEHTLAQLWSEVLTIEQIGIEDNFFALGGHSLIATQLISRVCKTFAIELPLKALFDTVTIEQLAEQVDLALWANAQTQTENTENMEFEDIDL